MTMLHDTCLVHGHHLPGSALARECPVLKAARRSEAGKRVWLERREEQGTTPGLHTGPARDSDPPKTLSNAPEISRTSETIIRDGRAHRPGRPRVSDAQKRTRARERARAYRARRAGGLTA